MDEISAQEIPAEPVISVPAEPAVNAESASASSITDKEEITAAEDDFEEKEDVELISSPAQAVVLSTPSEPNQAVAPRGNHLRESIINKDASALRNILTDPDVKNFVDLFEGTVIDIHK